MRKVNQENLKTARKENILKARKTEVNYSISNLPNEFILCEWMPEREQRDGKKRAKICLGSCEEP